MKKQLKMTGAICAVAVAALHSGGCAKQQVVQRDQMAPPAASTTAALPAKAVTPEEVKPEAKDPRLASPAVDEYQAAKPAQAAAAAEPSLKGALEEVFFDFDSYTLSTQARETLAKNAELLRKNGKAKLRIEGHCDELGSDDYNLALGERRARAAQKYLQTMGIAEERLSTISYGKEKPADPGHDEAARAKNRRDAFAASSD